MGVNRCYSLMKCLLIIFSIIFLCVGCGACALSGWALWEGRGGEEATAGGGAGAGAARAGLAAVAAWGGALALGAALALGGALRGSAPVLAGGAALLALAAVAEAGAAAWGARHAPALRRALRDELVALVRRDYGRSAATTDLVDALQRGLRCCGADAARDWHGSWWARRQGSGDGDGDGTTQTQTEALDLSVGAPPAHYWVPASCCAHEHEAADACEAARRVAAASGGGAGLHAAGCAPRALHALWAGARAPLAAAAALLVAHAAALLLALALCLRAQPAQRYKA